MKPLIIAEKPSVAADLAKALAKPLGKFEKKGKSRDSQYFEGDGGVIVSAVGHLVELKMPTGPNGKKLPWSFKVLPAIPEKFELQPIEDNAGRLKLILKLAGRKDVDLLVNACDAGREGELIFQYIVEYGGLDTPVKRLWMQSMTTSAIQQAWSELRDGAEMARLADAAKCRSEADWLVGLNSTRALTCFRSRHGGFNITAAGRVQTPTLAILADREREIGAFTAEDYFEVHARFAVAAGDYEAQWIDTGFKKDPDRPHGRAERIWERAAAEAVRDRCTGKDGTVSEETRPQKQVAPQLYDLTTLQREAPFTARQTLQIAQALYERHKMVTYPRTDSRYLPDDYLNTVYETTRTIAGSDLAVAPHAAASLERQYIGPNRRVFNNAKVSDHFAIIPTGRFVKLTGGEAKLYDMIVKRFLAVFYPAAEFEITKRLTTIEHDGGTPADTFRTNGKVLKVPGWLAVYGRSPGVAASKEELVPVTAGEPAAAGEVRVEALQTRPPARYTEATLLSAMEGAGKLIEDEELREAMAERGLGTPATRAAIIEGLLRQKYIARDGRELNVTGRGMRLIELCEEMKIEPLKSPSMTGEWEAKLNRMEHGQLDRETFMREITDFTEDVVEKARSHYAQAINRPFPDLDCACPNCGAPKLKQTDATYECYEHDCGFKITKYIAGRELTGDEARELFTDKSLPERDGFVSRFNKPFSAGLKLEQDDGKNGRKGKWKTGFVFDQDEPESAEDLGDEHFIRKLAVKDGPEVSLYATDKAYHIPELKSDDNPDGLRIGKKILQRELGEQEIVALVGDGKTPLLNGFISKRTKRPFKAHLTLDPKTGKVGFEFQERPKKKSAKKAPGK